jgi:hypothetical protein
MRSPARLNVAVSLLAMSFAIACSDSTGPKEQTSAQVAAHFDSIAIDAAARSQDHDSYGARGLLATLIELPAALGAVPAKVSVTTASGVESWKAYELLDVSPPGSDPDSSFVLLMFRDADAHTALIVFFDSTGTGVEGGVLTGDTISVNPTNAAATTSLTSVGSACATPAASLVNPQLGMLAIGTCSLAGFRTSLQLTLPTTVGMDAALTNVSFTNATVNGVRAVDQPAGASIQRIHDMLRAAKANRHF